MPIVVIGGVTASGKTSTAKKLKEIYNCDYIEADEYHPQENINKMHAGIPLTDEDRLPWLQRLHRELEKHSSKNKSCVITCSALKKVYRQILLSGSSLETDPKAKILTEDVYIIMLTLSKEVLRKRLIQRQHEHYMNPMLLDSQLETLELPESDIEETHTYVINCDGLSIDEIVQQIQKVIKQ